MFATLVWVLWSNRNNYVWNNSKEPGCDLGYKAKLLWDEWHAAQQLQPDQVVHVQQSANLQWQKPPDGWFKCNTDAGFHKDLNRTSGAWVLRDHKGMFVSAGTSWLEGNCSVIEGEAIALLDALQQLEQHGINHVIVERILKVLWMQFNTFVMEFLNLVILFVISIMFC